LNFIFGIPKKIIGFAKSVFAELRLVEWISLKETARLTTGVLIVTGVFALSIALTDKLFINLIAKLLQI
jgi:preprotein translocase SecE subunit